jgi:hypothetical protein
MTSGMPSGSPSARLNPSRMPPPPGVACTSRNCALGATAAAVCRSSDVSGLALLIVAGTPSPCVWSTRGGEYPKHSPASLRSLGSQPPPRSMIVITGVPDAWARRVPTPYAVWTCCSV